MFPAKEEDKIRATHDDSEGYRVAGGVKGCTNPVAREASRSWELGGCRCTIYSQGWRLETGDIITRIPRVYCYYVSSDSVSNTVYVRLRMFGVTNLTYS